MTVRTHLEASPQPLSTRYDVALLDLDGVCYAGASPIPHAAASITAARETGMRTQFVTNNASRSPEDVAAHLTALGIATSATEIVTAAQDVAAIMAEELPAGAKVLPVGAPALAAALRAEGFVVVDHADAEPVAVVQGLDKTIDWARLTEGAYALGQGANYYASNLDSTLPTERGMALGNGALVAALVHATGVTPVAAGKPFPGIFARAREKAQAQNPLGIGDRLGTDIKGAAAAGVPSLHVLTGVSDARAVVLAVPEERPAFLAVDLRGLNEPHPAVSVDGLHAQCREATVAVHPDGILMDGMALRDGAVVTLEQYRALVGVVWSLRDAGQTVEVPHFTVATP